MPVTGLHYLTKTEKTRNDVSVSTIWLTKLYVYRGSSANERSFVFSAASGIYLKTCVRFIVAGEFAIKALMRNNQYFYRFYSDTQLNSTDRRHCCVCTATMGI